MKGSLIILLALAATTLMRRRSAASRHWVLSAAIVCAAAMPLLERNVPSWYVGLALPAAVQPQVSVDQPATGSPIAAAAVPAGAGPQRSPAALAADPPVAPTIDLPGLLAWTWAVGAGVSLSILLIGLGRLTWLAARAPRLDRGRWVDVAERLAREYGLTRRVAILHSDHPTLLVTWGLLKPKVILPRAAAGWPEDRIRIVLGHELAHIQRGDWLMQMTAELVRAVYWFNPLLWVAGRRLRDESEQACDDVVLNLGIDAPEYATHLLDLARDASRRRRGWFAGVPAPAIARPSSLERRVRAMLNARLNRAPLTRGARAAAVVALLAVAIPLAGFGQNFVTFTGSVVDPAGRIIPGVTLVLSDAQRESKWEVRTDRSGLFEFAGVPAGTYALEAQFMGFRPLRENLALTGRALQKTIELQVGTLQETITVVGSPGDRSGGAGARTAARTARPAARGPAEYDPCSASPVGGCLKPPTKIVDVKPNYPQHLSDAKVGGVVRLSALIDVDGTVTKAEPVDAADPVDAALTDAAIAAVREWQFTPTQLGGVPIEVEMKVTVNFLIR